MVLWACVDECEEVQMNILLRLTEGAAHSVYTGGGGGGGGGHVSERDSHSERQSTVTLKTVDSRGGLGSPAVRWSFIYSYTEISRVLETCANAGDLFNVMVDCRLLWMSRSLTWHPPPPPLHMAVTQSSFGVTRRHSYCVTTSHTNLTQ